MPIIRPVQDGRLVRRLTPERLVALTNSVDDPDAGASMWLSSVKFVLTYPKRIAGGICLLDLHPVMCMVAEVLGPFLHALGSNLAISRRR